MIWRVLIAILLFLLILLLLPINLNIFYNGNFCISIKVLFFKYVIPLEKNKKASKKKPEKSVKTDGEAFGKKLSNALNLIKTVKKIVFKSISIKLFKAHIKVCADDPCDTALLFGSVNALCYAFYDVLSAFTKVSKTDINITADYNGEKTEVLLDIVIRTYIYKFLVGLISLIADSTIKSKDN